MRSWSRSIWITWHRFASINSITRYTSWNSSSDRCGVNALRRPIIWKATSCKSLIGGQDLWMLFSVFCILNDNRRTWTYSEGLSNSSFFSMLLKHSETSSFSSRDCIILSRYCCVSSIELKGMIETSVLSVFINIFLVLLSISRDCLDSMIQLWKSKKSCTS